MVNLFGLELLLNNTSNFIGCVLILLGIFCFLDSIKGGFSYQKRKNS